MDGATQQRAILRTSSTYLSWEQKVVTQILKTVSVNALIAWRINYSRSVLQDFQMFKSLPAFTNTMNFVESTANFTFNVFVRLIKFTSESESPSLTAAPSLNDTENEYELLQRAVARKRLRLPFFNSEGGRKIRLQLGVLSSQSGPKAYCALCGQKHTFKGHDQKPRTGHRSSISCKVCSGSLCVRVHD